MLSLRNFKLGSE